MTPEIYNTTRPVAELFKLWMHSPQSRTGKIYVVRSFFGQLIFSVLPFSCLELCIGGGLKKHFAFLELDGTAPLVGWKLFIFSVLNVGNNIEEETPCIFVILRVALSKDYFRYKANLVFDFQVMASVHRQALYFQTSRNSGYETRPSCKSLQKLGHIWLFQQMPQSFKLIILQMSLHIWLFKTNATKLKT